MDWKIVESYKSVGCGETGLEGCEAEDTRRVVLVTRAAREGSTGSSTSAPLAMAPLPSLPSVLLHAVERSRFVTILLFCVVLWEIQRNWEKTFISVGFCFGLGCGIIFGFWKRVRDLRQIRETHSILRRFNTTSGGEMQPPGSRVEPYDGSKRCGDCGFLPFSTICGMGDHFAYFGRQRWC